MMFGLRASAQRLRERIGNARATHCAGAPSPTETAALIAHALYQREIAGRHTTLRQVHIIAEMSQPEAMRAVSELESQGMLVIEDDLNDALESRVELTASMRARMEKILRRKAA